MKLNTTLSALVMLLIISSCASSKNMAKELYGHSWRLESFRTMTNKEFNEVFIEREPRIIFNKSEERVSGTTGCNGYSAEYKINGSSILFGPPGPSTMMYCGEGESKFLDAMTSVNYFDMDGDDRLLLINGEETIMTFTRIE